MFKPHLAITAVLVAMLLAGCGMLYQSKESASKKIAGEYEQLVTVLKPIEGVPISVSYQGGAIYRVQVNNMLPSVINLMWDESAYVNTKGESIRILHLQNRNDLARNPPAQQTAPPIAPDTQFQAEFIGENWLDLARRGATPQPKDGLRKAKLYLTFNITGKRVEWRGEITFFPPRKP